MKNKIFKILINLIIIMIILITPAHSEMLDDHKRVICNDCHGNGRFSYGEEPNDYCGNCHIYTSKQMLEEEHNPNTCNACHGVKESNSFHALHINVEGSCKTCHGTYGQSKPDKSMNECSGCHGGQIHAIHQDNIAGICVKCHGTRPVMDPPSESSFSTKELTAGIYAKVVDYRQYTLYELIKKLLGWS